MIVKHTAAGFVSDLYEDCGRDVLAGNGMGGHTASYEQETVTG